MFCPDMAVIRAKEGHERCINYDYCKGCGLCVVECPRNAMTLREEKL
jgi:Pyruvate/2-oxoacid:ferredoxin oxidoreductase delta subunit